MTLEQMVHYRDPSSSNSLPLCGSHPFMGMLLTDTVKDVTCPYCQARVSTKFKPASPPAIEAAPPPQSADDRQVGGSHYKGLGVHQPWNVMKAWYPDLFHGYLLMTAVAYLARADKKGDFRGDVKKAHHTLEKLIEELDGS